MGVHYVYREFGVGPGLPDFSARLLGSQMQTPSPMPAEPTSTPEPTDSVQIQLAQLLAVPLVLTDEGVASSSVSLKYIAEKKPLMVVLFGSKLSSDVVTRVVAELSSLPTPPVIAVDHEGGSVQRLSGPGFTVLPSWRELCASPVEKREALLASSAAELKKAGVDLILGPVIDRSASGSAMGNRACSSDPAVIARIAQEQIVINQEQGVASMIKHYPGIGLARADLHKQSTKIALKPEDVQPFETLLSVNGALPVMISHARIDPADPETPCSMSYLCVGELRQVFPEVLLVADALEMNSAGFLASSSAILRPLPERGSASVRAGVDVVLFGPSVTEAELDGVLVQMEKDFTRSGQLDARAQQHLARTKKWRATLQ